MQYNADTTGVPESGSGFQLLPEGNYWGVINDDIKHSVTRSGDDMFSFSIDIISPEVHRGSKIKTNITIYKLDSPSFRGMGITKHFLHCLGLEYEGQIGGDTDEWVGRQINFDVSHEPFISNKTGKELMSAKISQYNLVEENSGEEQNPLNFG